MKQLVQQALQNCLQQEGGSYVWFPSTGLNNAHTSNPEATPLVTTVYHVQVTNNNKCKSEDSIRVSMFTGNTEKGFQMPTAFTPNNDGLNDCFVVKSWGFVNDLKFSIFDRWGLLLFTANDPAKCWDGTFNGEKKVEGKYVYLISAKTICGNTQRKGTVVLIR